MQVDTDNPVEIREAIKKLRMRLIELQVICEHRFVPSNPKEPECSHPVCVKCGYDAPGWYCPESPDGECNYDQPDGRHNPDHCIYCGNPSERK